MLKKVYHLSTCSTCKRIIKELGLEEKGFTLQNVKEEAVSAEVIEQLREATGSYESLFNRRSVLYRERNLKEAVLSEEDYKSLLLEHYSFIKRPIIAVEDQFFVGNSKKTLQAAADFLTHV